MNVVWFNGWDAIVRTFVAGSTTYVALIFLLRFTGPRTLAKWYAFDLIVTVALGSTFANGVLSKDIPVAQALAGFVLLVLLQYLIGRVAVRYPKVVRFVNPAPVLLLVNGQLQEQVMHKNRVTRADLCKAARSNGLQALEDIAVIVLEPDGTFSVIDKVTSGKASALEDVPQFGKLFGDNRSDRPHASEKGAVV